MLQKRAKAESSRVTWFGVPLCAIAVAFLADVFHPIAVAQDTRKQTAHTANTLSGPGVECVVSVKSIIDAPLATRISLRAAAGSAQTTAELPEGTGRIAAPAGTYQAFVYVYDEGVPLLVHVAPLTLTTGQSAELAVQVLEGNSGNRPLRAFDSDFDLALDRVELEQGTDPVNARSVPGESPMEWPSQALPGGGTWYRGELHCYSSHGTGSESVAQLVKRAE